MSSSSSPSSPSVPRAAEDLSRMEGEYGSKMIGKLKQMNVGIIGLRGIGVETAKNLILAGPHSVVVGDDSIVGIADLGANFYLNQNHVGTQRGKAIVGHLGELNPNVNVRLHSGEWTDDEIQKLDVFCVTDESIPLETLNRWNAVCRNRRRFNEETKRDEESPVAFFLSSTNGVTGFIFSDFGACHLCFDHDGVAAKTIVIDKISNAKNGVVEVDGDRHLLNDGDLVKFEEVEGMDGDVKSKVSSESTFCQSDAVTEINAIHVVKSTKNPKRFLIGDTSKLGPYKHGGLGTQIKKQIEMKFEPLSQQLYSPTFISGYMDFTKFGRDAQLHLARLAQWEFAAKNGRLPHLHSEDDAKAMIDMARTIAAAHKDSPINVEVDEKVIRQYSLYCRTEISPMAALFGGILAQEITKQTGKYTPITQWFHFDAFELLDDSPPEGATPIGSRYDHQIALFGSAFQNDLMRVRTFLVGCGALGCEYMKAFAMMGIGCKGGQISITDDDRIELSNLSRQFLFRHQHVGSFKSVTAAASASSMNPDIKSVIDCKSIRVEPKSEDVFDDDFWSSRDFVVNALDNMNARKYVDSQCVLHGKPLFESGTLGTQANSVICLPHKTPSYSEGAIAGEDAGIAKCTLRNFPSEALHCIEWAREMFDEYFVAGADAVNSFLDSREDFFAKLKQEPQMQLSTLRAVDRWLQLSAAPTFSTCVDIAFELFLSSFRNSINDLTHNFPRDARIVDSSTGADLGPFWHGHKRFPQSTEFEVNDELHVDYVFHCANILASVFGLPEQPRHAVVEIASKLKSVPWKYSGAKVNLDEGKDKDNKSEEKSATEDDSNEIASLTEKLRSVDPSKFRKLRPADFEKDDDKNHHVDWITAATNLRSFNYSIKPSTRAKCRLTAGKIIPAIATTTACITGFIGLEVLKYVKKSHLEKFRAATINLATNIFCVENLPDPKLKKSGMDQEIQQNVVAIPEGYSCWDHVVVDKPNLTLQEFLDEFSAVHHGAVIDMLSSTTGKVLFSSTDLYVKDKKARHEQKLKTPIVSLWEEIVGSIYPQNRKYFIFECSVESESGDMGIVPTIKYIFKH